MSLDRLLQYICRSWNADPCGFSRICEVYATGGVWKQGVNDMVTDEGEGIGAVILRIEDK